MGRPNPETNPFELFKVVQPGEPKPIRSVEPNPISVERKRRIEMINEGRVLAENNKEVWG